VRATDTCGLLTHPKIAVSYHFVYIRLIFFNMMAEAKQGATPQAPDNFRTDFDFKRELPEALKALDAVSRNFYWSWQPEGTALFRELDPTLWEKVEQNPRMLLRRTSGLRLWQKAADANYVERVRLFDEQFRNYLSAASVASTIRAETRPLGSVDTLIGVARARSFTLASPPAAASVAYFCAEYGIHNSLPNYSGGLGILAGDHLKSASDLNVPLTAIGLLYRYGYFRQNIGHDGWQEERYHDVFDDVLAVSPVNDAEGNRITVSVHIRGREVAAQAWLAEVGRINLYLLDTNLEQNSEVDRLITGHLYGGDTETRIVQEKVLGIGGVRLLRKLGIDPTVYHLNEGHAAFSTLELASEFLAVHSDKNFADAVEAVRAKCVFTTHTPVAAGNDNFDPKTLRACFSDEFIGSLKLNDNEFLALGRADLSDDESFFGMTPLAIRMCRSTNGVSEKHGEVTRDLWLKMFTDLADPGAVPITHVTNGVHAPTWIGTVFQELYHKEIGANWSEVARDGGRWWEAIEKISDEEIWNRHCTLKRLMIAFIRERTRTKDAGDVSTIHEHEDTKGLFAHDVLTVGFARRVAAYKRWDLLFSDLPRLLRLVDDRERPVQFVFAGKAHPQDRTAKTILQKLMSINHDSNWQRRAVFLEDYDQEVARYLVQGVDVWMNLPRRPLEASGTSGMKAAMNGVLNFSILDGWWIEGFNTKNGFAIGDDAEARTSARAEHSVTDDSETDAADAESLYKILETKLIPTFYNRIGTGLPKEWIAMMKNSIATLTPRFCSDRMVRDYLNGIYSE